MESICKFGKSGKVDIVERFKSSGYDVTPLWSMWLPEYMVDFGEQLIFTILPKDFYTEEQYDGITEMRKLSVTERKRITVELYNFKNKFLSKHPEFKVKEPWLLGWKKLYFVETSIQTSSPEAEKVNDKPEAPAAELDPLSLAFQETIEEQVNAIELNPTYEVKSAKIPNKTVNNVLNALIAAGDSFVNQVTIGKEHNYNPHGVRTCINRLRKEVGVPVINKRGKGWKIAHSRQEWLQYLNSGTGRISDINFLHTAIDNLWMKNSA